MTAGHSVYHARSREHSRKCNRSGRLAAPPPDLASKRAAVRLACLEELESGPVAALAQHAEAVAARLGDANGGVRAAALRCLARDGSGGAARAGGGAARLDDSDSRVRAAAAVVALDSVPAGAAVLSAHATQLYVRRLEASAADADGDARALALDALLRELRAAADGAARAAAAAFSIVELLLPSTSWRVRAAALDGLAAVAELHPAALAEQPAACEAVVARLVDERPEVQVAALRALGRAGASTLGAHAAAVVRRLSDGEPAVCEAAVCALELLADADLARHAADLAPLLYDDNGGTRAAARRACRRILELAPDALGAHVALLS